MAASGTSGVTFEPYKSSTPTTSNEEDEDDQSRSCQENIDRGTAPCTWISKVTENAMVANQGLPPDILNGLRRSRVARAVLAIVTSSSDRPASSPVPDSAMVFFSRGSRHGIHRAIRVRMNTATTRYIRAWCVAQDDRGRALKGVTFLFELRRRRRGAGLESFRLIEQDIDAHVPRPSARGSAGSSKPKLEHGADVG